MNSFQTAVTEFHLATGGYGNVDTPEGRLLRAKLIMEEAVETVAALGFKANAFFSSPDSFGTPALLNEVTGEWERNPRYFDVEFEKEYDEFNILDFIDGLCDLTYVVMGGAVNIPVNIERHFEEVHAANMRKVAGKKFREDGKVTKPEGWIGPDHQRILDTYGKLEVGPNDRQFVDTHHG